MGQGLVTGVNDMGEQLIFVKYLKWLKGDTEGTVTESYCKNQRPNTEQWTMLYMYTSASFIFFVLYYTQQFPILDTVVLVNAV